MPKIDTTDRNPTCTKCGGPVRPNILMFDEQYDTELKNQTLLAAQEADTIVVIGTMLETSLACEVVKAGISTFKKKTIIEINPEPVIEIGETYTLRLKAEDIVPQLCDSIIKV